MYIYLSISLSLFFCCKISGSQLCRFVARGCAQCCRVWRACPGERGTGWRTPGVDEHVIHLRDVLLYVHRFPCISIFYLLKATIILLLLCIIIIMYYIYILYFTNTYIYTCFLHMHNIYLEPSDLVDLVDLVINFSSLGTTARRHVGF